jgi:DNA topoisomerase IA
MGFRALREQGIGRPATYAGIVETLLSRRKYAERSPEGTLRLTKRGRAVLDFLTGRYPALFAPGFTAEAEQLLDKRWRQAGWSMQRRWNECGRRWWGKSKSFHAL